MSDRNSGSSSGCGCIFIILGIFGIALFGIAPGTLILLGVVLYFLGI
jgi:hypothetical protein